MWFSKVPTSHSSHPVAVLSLPVAPRTLPTDHSLARYRDRADQLPWITPPLVITIGIPSLLRRTHPLRNANGRAPDSCGKTAVRDVSLVTSVVVARGDVVDG